MMADHESSINSAKTSELTIRKMAGTAFSLLVLIVVIAYIWPWLNVSIPAEIRNNLLNRNEYISGMKPAFLFVLCVSQKTVVSIAVIDTILNQRVAFGLFKSFGIYIAMGLLYLVLAQADIPNNCFCALVFVMAIVSVRWYFKKYSKNKHRDSVKVFQLFKGVKELVANNDESFIDCVIVVLGMIVTWLLYFVDIAFFAVYLFSNWTAFF
jgi:hypothetical protein